MARGLRRRRNHVSAKRCIATTINDAEVLRYVDTLASLPFKERCLIRCLFTLFEVEMVVTQPLGQSASLRHHWMPALIRPVGKVHHMQRVAFQALRSLILWAYVVAKEFGMSRWNYRSSEY